MSSTPIKPDTLNIDFTTAPDPVLFDANLVATYGCMLDARCDDDCDLDCAAAVPEDRRLDAYREFCDATAADRGDLRVAQNAYLCGCIELRERTVDTDDHIIEQTPEFWLGGDGIKVRVCRTFFARTLGLPNARLDALLEPDTLEWFSWCVGGGGDDGQAGKFDGQSSAMRRRGDLLRRQPYTDFVLNSRKYLDKNSSAFVEETDSDVDVCLDDIVPSVYKNVVNHIQTIPRVVSTWVNQENDQEKFQFESSINCHYMYLNYLKKMKTNKKKVTEKQYKKIYNKYVDDVFMS